MRLAPEIRIFPLLTLSGEPSPYVEDVVDEAERRGGRAVVLPVGYEVQRGGNRMLRITRTAASGAASV